MYLNIKTGYSFRSVFAPMERLITKCKPFGFAGIADLNNTYGHVEFEKECIKQSIKPIFGVTLQVCETLQRESRREHLNDMIFVAKNRKGLKEIYSLVEIAHDQFWYNPRITFKQVNELSKNVLIISGFAPMMEYLKPKNIYQQVSPGFPKKGIIKGLKPIACVDNNYIDEDDKTTYESFADERLLERKTYPQHLLKYDEWLDICGNKLALKNLKKEVKKIENFTLSKAPLVKYIGNDVLENLCRKGAKTRKIDISKPPYKERYDYELKIIKEKGFDDYFLVVADLIKKMKTTSLVGPGRGSSGGSLICYLLNITEINPIKYGLIFERFIDINRTDLPDIDIDFQHDKRKLAIKYLETKYEVAQIANISRLAPKENLNRIAKNLCVPLSELTEVKSLIPVQKAQSFDTKHLSKKTEPGKRLFKKYPRLKQAIKTDNHPIHSSIHAAGILVANNDLANYCGINSRKEKIAMVDMSSCEHLELLKIDALALKTMTVLSNVLKMVNLPYEFLYNLPDGDKKAYKLLNSKRLTGIFQMEGRTMRGLLKTIKITSIEDISALSALGRPGPIKAGSARKYIKRKKGEEKVDFPDNHKTIKKTLKETYGVIVYQEQIMKIAREYSQMKWEDVINLRKVIGKSKGAKELQKFRKTFDKKPKGKNPSKVWEQMKTFGGYGFVKAHSIAYATITYWCAYLKAHYPTEFAVSLLNVITEINDKTKINQAVQVLRDLRETEKIKHIPYNIKHSQLQWSVRKGKLLGGLTTIHGIGLQNARTIIRCREEKTPIPEGIKKHIKNGISPFNYIYPRKQLYGDYPGKDIASIKETGRYRFLGKLLKKTLKDANDLDQVARRDGKLVEAPTTYIIFIVADDTADLMCMVSRLNYEKEGTVIADFGKIDESWYHLEGEYNPGYNLMMVDSVKEITR